MIIWKSDTDSVAEQLRLSIDGMLKTARDMLEKERGRLFKEGEREAYDLTWHCEDIEFELKEAVRRSMLSMKSHLGLNPM